MENEHAAKEKGKEEVTLKSLSPKQIIGGLMVGLLLFTWWLLGWGGVTTLLTMALLYVLPFWFFMKPFGLDSVERLVFAIMGGFGIFAYLVYYLNFILGSLKLEVYLVGGLLLIAAGYVWYAEKKKA